MFNKSFSYLLDRKNEYDAAKPYPHLVQDEVFNEEWLQEVASQFPQDPEDYYCYPRAENPERVIIEGGKCAHKNPQGVRCTRELIELLIGEEFTSVMRALTGINGLVANSELYGAGLHMVRPGGRRVSSGPCLQSTKRSVATG